MTNDYSDMDLIRFLYAETNRDQTLEIKEKALEDPGLMERINVFQRILQSLDLLRRNPSDTSVQIVLEYNQRSKPVTATC